jgi:hypothetical protein
MKSFILTLVVVFSFTITSTVSAQTSTVDYINQSHMQVGLQTGVISGAQDEYVLVQFNFAQYSRNHLGFYLEPTIGLAGRHNYQVMGSVLYVISGGLQWTPWTLSRSAILGGYSWAGKYDGIQLQDPANRRYQGPWVGYRYNFLDGLWVPHGNLSVMAKVFFYKITDRATGWNPEYSNYYMLTVAYNCDL